MRVYILFIISFFYVFGLSAQSEKGGGLESKDQKLQQEIDYLLYRIDNPPPKDCLYDEVGFAFFGSPIYWRASEEGLEYAVLGQYETFVGNRTDLLNGKTKEPDFNWDWGFRVGVNIDVRFDDWEIYTDWTHFRSTATSSISVEGNPNPSIVINTNASGQYISPFWVAKLFDEPGFLNTGDAKWEMRIDMIDLLLERQYMVTNYLFLKPYIGLRNGWIHQKYGLLFTGLGYPTLPTQLNRVIDIGMRNNFWGIGPKLGFNSEWVLGRGFSIYGNLAFSVLDGWFNLTYKIDDATLNDQGFTIQTPNPAGQVTVIEFAQRGNYANVNRIHRDVGIGELALGLRWERNLYERACLGIWAGYEQNLFFGQNQFMNHQYDFSLVTIVTGLEQSGGPNYFTDRGNLSTNGFSGGIDLAF